MPAALCKPGGSRTAPARGAVVLYDDRTAGSWGETSMAQASPACIATPSSGGATGDGTDAIVQRSAPSRRAFIKGVIASGAAASAAGYLFRGPGISSAHAQAAGTVERLVTLNVNGASRRVDVLPQETLAIRSATSSASPARSWAAITVNAAPAPSSSMAPRCIPAPR